MGTLSEELAVTILRNFSLAQATVQSQWEADLAARMNKPPVWNWTPGTFVFPEGLCCYCGGIMRSVGVWRTDNLQFLGSWKVVSDGGGVGHFEFDDEHPHVNGGSICMGSGNFRASSVGDALFMAFNPLSMYLGGDVDEGTSAEEELKEWLADRFDHRCGERTDIKAAEGIDLRHAVAPEDGCHCQFCRIHRGEVQCRREGCGQWYSPNVGHGRFRCTTCVGERSTVRFCVKHKHDRHGCTSCGDSYDLYDTVLGQLDPNPNIKQCGECEKWLCWNCEAPDSGVVHSCGVDEDASDPELEDDEDQETDCDHHCADCCEDNNCERCEICGYYPNDCDC